MFDEMLSDQSHRGRCAKTSVVARKPKFEKVVKKINYGRGVVSSRWNYF